MSAILLPNKVTQQPSQPNLTNRSRLLAGAKSVIVGGTVINLASGLGLTTVGTGVAQRAASVGIVESFRKNFYRKTESIAIGTASFIEIWSGIPVAYGTSGSATEAGFLTGSSNNLIGIAANGRNSGTTWGAVYNWPLLNDSLEVLPLGVPTTIIAARFQDRMELWRDGRLVRSLNQAPMNYGTATMVVGSFLEDTAFWASSNDTVFAARILGEWSTADLAAVSQKPWQIFTPAPRRIWSAAVADSGVTGALSVAEGADTFAASGSVVSTSVSGTLAVSEGADTLASSGAVAASTVTGDLVRSEGADTATGTGATAFATITGTATVSEASDTAQASGAIGNAAMGTLARQEGSDTLTAAGAVAYPAITASLARQEAPDSLVASGSLLFAITGMMAAIELPDTLQASSPAPSAPKLNLYTTMRDSPVNVSTPLGAPVNLAGTMLPSVINLYTTMRIPAVNMTANLGAPVNITGNLL